MLKQLRIQNFRCYKDSVITFNGSSILVGRNNAGKSTMIEALKIISSVTRKFKALRYTRSPEWLPDVSEVGVSPNVDNMNISDRGIFYMYGDAPAIIEAEFKNGSVIKAYVGEDLDIFAVIYSYIYWAVKKNSRVIINNEPLEFKKKTSCVYFNRAATSSKLSVT